ncbi:MAG: hypothetical protein IJ662_12845 [Clostridia bacterium]|nr:hypothetical protein [Clostridia bacterium]
MKRWISVLLLAVLLLTALPAWAEETDISFIVAEKWVAENGSSLEFLDTGVGVYTSSQGASHEGTWTITDRTIVLTYEQYGTRELKITLSSNQGDPQLWANGATYLQVSVDARRRQEAEEAAKKAKAEADSKTYALKWKEQVELDFIRFSIDNCALYRSMYEVLPENHYTLDVKKGTKYFVLNGTVENPGSSSMAVYSMHAQVTFDNGETYPFEIRVLPEEKTYLNYDVDAKTSTQWFMFAEISESLAKSFKTAKVRINFFDQFAEYASTEAEGDYFFSVNITEKKADAIRKTTAKKVTYFKEKSKLPKPESYVDVVLSSVSEGKNVNGKVVEYYYYYYARYSDSSMEKLVTSYINALKKAGLTIKKKTSYSTTTYTITSGKTELGSVSYYDGSSGMTVYFKK